MVSVVALRKESVDRNSAMQIVIIVVRTSLSARRAWIEIWGNYIVIKMSDNVALRKESVDRNAYGRINDISRLSRSPQGERG